MADEDNTTPKSGEKPQKRGRKRAKTKRFFKKRYIFLLLIIAAALFWVGWRYFSSFVSTDDAFVEGHIIRVSPKISGIISKLHIDDNEHVKKGALLIEIDDRDFKVRYEQAKASYDMALYRQKSAKATENAADIDLELAKQDLERYEGLFKKGAVSQQELDRARSKYEQARASLTGAQENVFSKRKNKVADAELQKLKAAMEQAKLDLSYTKIYATEDGKITNRSAEEGAYIHTGSPMFSLVPDKRWVVANYKETQLEHIKPGQNVEIKVDAYPGVKFKGKVDSIQSSTGAKMSMFPPENAVGSYVKVVQRVPVKIIFTEPIDPKYNIEPGMSVIPKVFVK